MAGVAGNGGRADEAKGRRRGGAGSGRRGGRREGSGSGGDERRSGDDARTHGRALHGTRCTVARDSRTELEDSFRARPFTRFDWWTATREEVRSHTTTERKREESVTCRRSQPGAIYRDSRHRRASSPPHPLLPLHS